MVFGNMASYCATGVVFTRNPTDGTNTITNGSLEKLSLKYNPKGGAFDLNFSAMYQDYVGKLWDVANGQYLPNLFKSFLPFKNASPDSDPIQLFNNVPGNKGNFRIGFNKKLTPDVVKRSLSVKQDDINKYRDSVIAGNIDAGLEQKILSAYLPMGPMLMRLMGSNDNLPVFTQKLDQLQDVPVGSQLATSIKNSAKRTKLFSFCMTEI